MKKLYILKIGGSVLTYKDRTKLSVRRSILVNIARRLKIFLDTHKNVQLIIIHGAGQAGHSVAKKYNLASGVFANKIKIKGALLCNAAIQKLHEQFMHIFAKAGLDVYSVDPMDTLVQESRKIIACRKDVIQKVLAHGKIPVLYGHMVFDVKENMSICSGDDMATYLVQQFSAQKLLFATDVDGIFNKDPFKHDDAVLLKKVWLRGGSLKKNIKLSTSHSTDVTNGLMGKVQSFKHILKSGAVPEVVIFNGLKKERYVGALMGKNFISTKVVWRSMP